ncbi:MAG: serine/threonine protein kinase, partial [Ktedonobacteraceae bacterium]
MQQERLILPVGTTVRDPNGNYYVIEELLGRGGFGAVYLVKDWRIEQRVFALKEIIDPSASERDRFTFEAELLKRLHHKALPRVYHVFENEKLKRVYMLMDYIKGRDLEVLLAEQPEKRFSLPLILTLMAPVVDALIYMHDQIPPIVHRDIKPANIIVPMRGEEAVLVDFGLAKEYIEGKTTNIIRHGSPGYAALEQYGHGGTMPRTDIYGLGATLYTLLTGIVPIDPVSRIAENKGFDPLEPVSLIAPNVPAAVARTIQRAMSISVEDRFSTVKEFWRELTAGANRPLSTSDINAFRAEMATLKTPQPLAVTEQKLPPGEDVSPPLMSYIHAPPVRKRHSALFSIVITLLLVLLVGIGASLLFSVARYNGAGHPTAQTPLLTTTRLITPTSTPTFPTVIYPSIASSYGGRVGDVLSKGTTPMFLDNVQQKQANFRGYFRGLGLAGPFTGSVTSAGRVQFSVSIQGGSTTLAFTGDIKVGGDMVGGYKVLDQRG